MICFEKCILLLSALKQSAGFLHSVSLFPNRRCRRRKKLFLQLLYLTDFVCLSPGDCLRAGGTLLEQKCVAEESIS